MSNTDPTKTGGEPRCSQMVSSSISVVICCLSAKQEARRSKSKDWLARNQNNVSSGVTYLSADCSVSELALYKSISTCWSRTKRASSHQDVTCTRHDILVAKIVLILRQTINTHSHLLGTILSLLE